MTTIELQTVIMAPMEICFDLSRSIDLHQFTTKKTGEKAIDGRTSGLIEKDEWVKWRATHFGVRQTLTVKITEMERPKFFRDVMLKGAFRSMSHDHLFEPHERGTLMTDRFYYQVPFWIAGKLFNSVILKPYMANFLRERNDIIREIAESDRWKEYLPPQA